LLSAKPHPRHPSPLAASPSCPPWPPRSHAAAWSRARRSSSAATSSRAGGTRRSPSGTPAPASAARAAHPRLRGASAPTLARMVTTPVTLRSRCVGAPPADLSRAAPPGGLSSRCPAAPSCARRDSASGRGPWMPRRRGPSPRPAPRAAAVRRRDAPALARAGLRHPRRRPPTARPARRRPRGRT